MQLNSSYCGYCRGTGLVNRVRATPYGISSTMEPCSSCSTTKVLSRESITDYVDLCIDSATNSKPGINDQIAPDLMRKKVSDW